MGRGDEACMNRGSLRLSSDSPRVIARGPGQIGLTCSWHNVTGNGTIQNESIENERNMLHTRQELHAHDRGDRQWTVYWHSANCRCVRFCEHGV